VSIIVFIFNASSSSTTCPRKPNSMQNVCFHEFPERRFERIEAEVKHRDLRGDDPNPHVN
jgi:hypothetical protein